MLFLDGKKRILLIEPPFYKLFGYQRWHYPVTLTLVGTYLEEQGHEVLIYDADRPSPDCRSLKRTEVSTRYPEFIDATRNSDHPVWADIKTVIEDFKPDVIGMTAISAKIDSADKIAAIAKELYGDKIFVMLGGPHVAGMRAMYPTYDFGPDYDMVIHKIPDLVNRKPNKNLLSELQQYSAANLSCILTSTGCPNSCTFCCNSFNKKIIYRNIKSIYHEINELKAIFSGKESIYFLDDCLLSNSKRFMELSAIIKKLELHYTAGSRIMALSPDKLDTFIESGGTRLYVGVESGSQVILDKVKKKLKIEEIKKRTQWLNDRLIPWSAFFVAGFPFETIDDIKKTEELMFTIRPTFISLNRFTPYPGTEIYQNYFMNSDIDFIDLFQLNRNSHINLGNNTEDYIDNLFLKIDEYNSSQINNIINR